MAAAEPAPDGEFRRDDRRPHESADPRAARCRRNTPLRERRLVGAPLIDLGEELGREAGDFAASSSRATSPCSAWASPATGSMTRSTRSRSSTSTVTVVPIIRFGTEQRADPNRMQQSLSTFLVIGFGPTAVRNDGSSPRRCR